MFEPFLDLQRTLRQLGNLRQHVSAVGVDTDMPVMTSVRTSDHFARKHLRYAGRLIPFHFGCVGVLQRLLAVLVRERPNECRYLRVLLVKTPHQRLDLFGLDEGFIALYIDDDGVGVVLFAPGRRRDRVIGLQTAVGTAGMVRTRHHDLSVKILHRIVDAIIVRRYQNGLQGLRSLVIDTPQNGLTAYVRQGFTREAGRTVTRRYDTYKFHL